MGGDKTMDLRLDKSKFPLGSLGEGALDITIPGLSPSSPLPLDQDPLASATVKVVASDKWSWGGDASAKLAVDGNTHLNLLI